MKVHKDINLISGIQKPILTVGTFDGVHIGHQSIISRINELADKLGGESVLLTFHPHPRMVLFPDDDTLKLINTIDEKLDLLARYGLKHVINIPFVKEFSRMSPVEYVRDILVNQIGIDTIVIGYDHHFGRNRQGNLKLLQELAPLYEFNVEEISAQDIDEITVSSTKVRKSILDGDIKSANEFLGYRFMLSGKVVKGKQIGRAIGFPTANLFIEDKHKIIPKNGVYIVNVKFENNEYKGILNIGINPTVNENSVTSIEVHLLDVDIDLYGEYITLFFVDRIRDEQKFDNLEDLKKQIEIDEQVARGYLLNV